MQKKSNDDIDTEVSRVINEIIEENQCAPSVALVNSAPQRRFLFGVALVLLGIFTVVAGTYPLGMDHFYRVTFFIFSIILVLIGAWNIDRAIRANAVMERPSLSGNVRLSQESSNDPRH